MPKAEVISFTTRRPIADDASPADQLALLRVLAGRAWEAGADPSAPVSPDHELLMLCDDVMLLKRQADRAWADWVASGPLPRPEHDEWKRAKRALRAPLVKLGKLHAVTPVGIFAKAIVVRQVGIGAASLAVSLAVDLLNGAELREAIWPAGEQ